MGRRPAYIHENKGVARGNLGRHTAPSERHSALQGASAEAFNRTALGVAALPGSTQLSCSSPLLYAFIMPGVKS